MSLCTTEHHQQRYYTSPSQSDQPVRRHTSASAPLSLDPSPPALLDQPAIVRHIGLGFDAGTMRSRGAVSLLVLAAFVACARAYGEAGPGERGGPWRQGRFQTALALGGRVPCQHTCIHTRTHWHADHTLTRRHTPPHAAAPHRASAAGALAGDLGRARLIREGNARALLVVKPSLHEDERKVSRPPRLFRPGRQHQQARLQAVRGGGRTDCACRSIKRCRPYWRGSQLLPFPCTCPSPRHRHR